MFTIDVSHYGHNAMAKAFEVFSPFHYTQSERFESGITVVRSLRDTRDALDRWVDRHPDGRV